MAKKQNPPPPRESVALKISRDEATSRIEDRIAKGIELLSALEYSQESYERSQKEYTLWNDYNKEMLKRIFTTDEISEEYSSWAGGIFSGMPSLSEQVQDHRDDIDQKINRLKSILNKLELIPAACDESQPQTATRAEQKTLSKKVFLVHGHDELAKTNLEIFLSEIGLEPVVLHREADEGQTIIEKFEKHSNVDYAFILLTPDEVAYLAANKEKPDNERTTEFRARPNVIFEFGYFVGKLGRSHTCCLYTGNVALPSDINGMIYKQFNNNNIEEIGYSIIKELKSVGYKIN